MSNNGKGIPKDYVFKPGDRVELVVEVVADLFAEDASARLRVGVLGFPPLHVISGDELRTGRLLPPPLKKGNKVRRKGSSGVATIISVDGEWAWLRLYDDSRSTDRIADLELAP